MIEVVAELSCNHNNNIAILDQLLDELLASDDVTCIKLQAFQAVSCTSKDRQFALDGGQWAGRQLYDLMVEAETPIILIQHAALRIRECRKKLMLSINSWDDLCRISHFQPDYIKLPSPESLDIELAKRLLQHKYNLVVSTGVISDAELEKVVLELTPLVEPNNSLTILHCVSQYPTDFSRVQLSRINYIKSLAPLASIGISDHTKGDLVPMLAIGYGISMVEKHVMPSSHDFHSLDSTFSMTTTEFLDMARKVSLSSVIIGSQNVATTTEDHISETYWQNRISAHASHTLEAGQQLTPDDIVFLRPGDGISPLSIRSFFGKKLSKDVKAGFPLYEAYF